MHIEKTSDYDKFKTIIGNRVISKSHTSKLMSSIVTRNLLENNPIIVNDGMEVIDGQHRLMAAKNLGLPIYYTKSVGTTIPDVQLLNSTNKTWTMEDFCNSYIGQGNRNYQELLDFTKMYKIKMSTAIIMLTFGPYFTFTHKRRMTVGDFKLGRFKIIPKWLEWSQNLMVYINQIRPYTDPGIGSERFFMEAMKTISENITADRLEERLRSSGTKIHRATSAIYYLRQIEDVVNKNLNKKDRIRLY